MITAIRFDTLRIITQQASYNAAVRMMGRRSDRERRLRARGARILRAFAQTLFNVTADDDPRLDVFVLDARDFLQAAGPKTRLAISAALTGLQFYPLLSGTWTRFTRMSGDARETTLHKMESGPLAIAFAGLKTVSALVWFEKGGAETLPVQIRTPRGERHG